LQPFIGRELFAAGFVSCWAQLNETSQKQLVRSLEMAFSSPNIPPEILGTLLNLVYLFSFSIFTISIFGTKLHTASEK
jgi:phosphatidylinositol kinase/protein kinase (PI-3  family)